IGTNSGYTFGSPNQATISINNSNPPSSTSTRIFFPPTGATFASPRNIEIRVASTNSAVVWLYGDGNLLTFTNLGVPNSVFSFVTNFPPGGHTIYSVGYGVTSAPIHFSVLGTNAIHPGSPSLGVSPTANSSFVLDANGALFDWGDDRYANLGDGGLSNVGPT